MNRYDLLLNKSLPSKFPDTLWGKMVYEMAVIEIPIPTKFLKEFKSHIAQYDIENKISNDPAFWLQNDVNYYLYGFIRYEVCCEIGNEHDFLLHIAKYATVKRKITEPINPFRGNTHYKMEWVYFIPIVGRAGRSFIP